MQTDQCLCFSLLPSWYIIVLVSKIPLNHPLLKTDFVSVHFYKNMHGLSGNHSIPSYNFLLQNMNTLHVLCCMGYTSIQAAHNMNRLIRLLNKLSQDMLFFH